MDNFIDIIMPTESADGYYMNRQKSKVENFIYIDEAWYSKLLDPNTFYILGPKGSGKTLYAAYMCAEMRNNTISRSHTIDVGDYGKLIAMKVTNHLNFTDYLTMWKVILLQKFLLGLKPDEISFWGRSKNFKEIQDTISDYFGYDVSDDSFNPITVIDSCDKQNEVTSYLHSQFTIEAVGVSAGVGAKTEQKDKQSRFKKSERVAMSYTDTWMRSINEFKKVIEKVVFKYNHYLFIDGLDVRPREIDAKEYSECIGALVRAVYDINTKLLGNIDRKDEKEFKIIALTRTDIFLNSDLVNVTSCISDNCVELDWTYSNENEFVYSNLYNMMNRVLGWDGESSDYPLEKYFSFEMRKLSKHRAVKASMFIQRQSRLRPRDVVVMMHFIQDECRKRGLKNPNSDVLCSQNLENSYSSYYADQIKSEMMFLYSSEEIKDIFQMLKTLRCETFTEENFKIAFEKYITNNQNFTLLFPNYRSLLDKLYSLDLIGWSEIHKKQPKLHWHYREVKPIDESYRMPWEQIDIAEKVKFIIHRGVSKNILGTI